MNGGVVACPSCGRESPADAAFCAGCGTALDGKAGPDVEERKVVTYRGI